MVETVMNVVERVRLHPGDVMVLYPGRHMRPEELDALKAQMKQVADRAKVTGAVVVIMEPGMRLSRAYLADKVIVEPPPERLWCQPPRLKWQSAIANVVRKIREWLSSRRQ